MDYKLLENLCNLAGVSGYETEVLSYIAEAIKDAVDGLEYDNMGNLMAFKKGVEGTSGKRILYSCHADEVGFVIKHIEEDGSLLFDAIGMDPLVFAGKRVIIGKNRIPGIIATKPIHLLSQDERDKTPENESLYIDIGAKTKEEAQKLGVFADFAVFDTKFSDFGEDMIKAKAIDDRIGCALLIELIERGVRNDSYFAFCTAEEIGCRGSKAVSERIKPDICINIESTTAGDMPELSGGDRVCFLGGGAVVPFMDGASVYSNRLYKKARALADEKSIPCQTKTKVAGGTDASSYTKVSGGCEVLGLAVPTRYIHSPSCVAKKSDIEAAQELLYEISDNIGNFLL